MRALILLACLLHPLLHAQPTWTREVSRIVQTCCQICHRPNDIAPFSLMEYSDAASRVQAIRRAVANRIMPPWKPVPGFGEFRDSYALTDDERRTILDWIDAGAPEGDPADLPPPPEPRGEWPLGDPDLVVQMLEPYTPRLQDDYRCFVLPTDSDLTRYVTAAEVLPGNRGIVHHVLLFLDTSGESERLDAKEDGPGYTCFGGPGFTPGIAAGLGGWVPGLRAHYLPDGIAMPLPARARVVMQVHYHPTGSAEPDQTRVGLYFARQPVERRLFFLPIVNLWFEIPAGAGRHEVRAQFLIPPLLDAKAILIAPHMHLLGRQIKVELRQPGQNWQPLIYINDWDFSWQAVYTYAESVPMPAFSAVRATCVFDNSAGNPRNPNNPPKPVRWGEGTEDEMCLVFLGITLDNEGLFAPFLP